MLPASRKACAMAACQQESLCDVHQRAVGNVVDVQHLVECQDDAADNE